VLTYGETPEVSTDTWQLRVWGLAKEATFSWSDFMAMPLPPDHGGPMRLVVPHLYGKVPNVLETQRLSPAGRALGRGTLRWWFLIPLTLVPRVSLGMGSPKLCLL